MLTRNQLASDRARCIDRATGALCGLAIGDSLGDAARKETNQANYGITTDFTTASSWSTDDTEFALLCAKTLIACKGKLETDHVVKTWLSDVAVQDEFKRGGASEITAAKNLLNGLRPPVSGRFNTYHASDGAAMRIAPVGIVCAGDPKAAAAMAKIEAEISHAEDGVYGAQAVAAAVAVAMVDGTMDEILSAALDAVPQTSWLYANLSSALELVDRAGGKVALCWMQLHELLFDSYRATTAEAIPAIFACLKLMHDDFRSGLILAANYGRDADTIGAVAGAILGAKYGRQGIPAAWVEKTRYPTGTCLAFCKGMDIVAIGEQLAKAIQ